MVDETALVQINNEEEKTFFNKSENELVLKDSSWNNFPTDDEPYAKYKYIGAAIKLNENLLQVKRKTDSLLDWLSDWGGLLDGLKLIGHFLLDNYSILILKSKLIWTLVSYKPSNSYLFRRN